MNKMNQCNKSFLVEKNMNRRSKRKGTAAYLVFCAGGGDIKFVV
jgi:hypothetical protein